MKALDLPEPIAAYFDADRHDGQAVARCFTRDGVVLDEGHTHSGLAAIEAWKTDAASKYTYTATPQTLETQGRSYIVTSRVSGDFPGSPLRFTYRFTLVHGAIKTLETTV